MGSTEDRRTGGPNLTGLRRRASDPVLCPYCGAPTTHIVEFQIHAKPLPRSGRSRGKRAGGFNQRVCQKHAEGLYRLMERAQEQAQQRRFVGGGAA